MKRRHRRVPEQDVARLSRAGLTDDEIGTALGHHGATIGKVRRRLGLPSHWWGPRHRARFAAAARSRAHWRGGCFARAARQDYAAGSGWPPGLRPWQVAVLNVLAALGVPATRAEVAGILGTSVGGSLYSDSLRSLVARGLVATGGRAHDTSPRHPHVTTFTLGPAALAALEERARCETAKTG
jgi:hypothetical protein